MAETQHEWDPSNYFLGSLAAAVFILALAGATNIVVWVLFTILWAGIAVAVSHDKINLHR